MTATVEQTTWALQHLPEWAALLPEALRSPRKSVGPSGRSGDPAELSLYSLEISALLSQVAHHLPMPVFGPRGAIGPQRMGIRPALATWAAALELEVVDADDAPDVYPLDGNETIAELCTWLTQRDLLAWADDEWLEWPEFSDDVISLTTRTYAAVVHLVDEREAPDDDPICARCRAGRIRTWTDGSWSCDNCGRAVTVTPVTLAEAAQRLGHSARTIRHWAANGRFTRILGDDGKPRYDLGEIAAAVARARLTKPTLPPESPAGPDPDTGTPTISEAVRSPHSP